MKDFFAGIGVVTMVTVSISLLVIVVNGAYEAVHNSYYKGLIKQLIEARDDLFKVYGSGDIMTREACAEILMKLAKRESPCIQDIKSKDGEMAKIAATDTLKSSCELQNR